MHGVEKVHKMLAELQAPQELQTEEVQQLDFDHDGTVSQEDVTQCLKYIVDTVNGALPYDVAEAVPETGAFRLQQVQRQHTAVASATTVPQYTSADYTPGGIPGRSVRAFGIPGDTTTVYQAHATGGISKTSNGGELWEYLGESVIGAASIGALEIAPSDPNVLYVGTGEPLLYTGTISGHGVYKSTDAGQTWEHVGLEDCSTIGKIAVHPVNPDIVYVASSGYTWSRLTNGQGLFRSTDGGVTWEKVLDFPCDDVLINADGGEFFYKVVATTFRRLCKGYKYWDNLGGDYTYKCFSNKNDVYYSEDMGSTFTKVIDFDDQCEKVNVAACLTQPRYVYAEARRVVDPTNANSFTESVWKSSDYGKTFTEMYNAIASDGTYGWFTDQIRVHPTNPEHLTTGGVNYTQSTDSGASWQAFPIEGWDHHDHYIDPTDTNRSVHASDGGTFVTNDNWDTSTVEQGPGSTCQHHCVVLIKDTASDELYIGGSMQDSGRGVKFRSLEGSSLPFDATGNEWTDAFVISDTEIAYLTDGGIVWKSNVTSGSVGYANSAFPSASGFKRHRPVCFISNYPSQRVYVPAWNGVWMKTSFDSDTDKLISPPSLETDLYPTGFESQACSAMAEDLVTEGVLYVGTNVGLLWMTSNGLAENPIWVRRRSGLFPKGQHLNKILCSMYAEGTVYVSFNGRKNDVMKSYILRSTDFGASWEEMHGDLPESPVNDLVEHPTEEGILFCCTDLGIYRYRDGWECINGSLPNIISVRRIGFYHGKFVVGTYGRGLKWCEATDVM